MKKRASKWSGLERVALIGSYLPRRCGIGTFTTDLAESLASVAPELDVWAVAMNDRPEGYTYPHRVKFEVHEDRISDYRQTADFLNLGRANVVCLQHEYGIFGGEQGKMVLELISRLRMSVITTLHTVLKSPSQEQRRVLAKLADFSDRLIVMSEVGRNFLREIYQVPDEKIVLIPHGVHDLPFVDPNYYKDTFGVEGKKVLLTFGLLSPNKGVEHVIDALPEILSRHPEVVYIALGATHPSVKAVQGEDYRLTLERRARERGVSEHVIFHNKFVDLEELKEFLGVADLYLTPYLSETQIVSGTLAYAMGAGKAVISTPYWYAKEMLAEGRGLLVPFADPVALAAKVNELLDDEVERHAIRKRAYQHTRPMCWREVAAQYLDLFTRVEQERSLSPRTVFHFQRLREQTLDLPEIQLAHLETLTDDTGIYQHAHFTVPRRCEGYCTDDNARALIVVTRSVEHTSDSSRIRLDALASRYLSFLEHAFCAETGRFHNFMSFDRRWTEDIGSQDSHGRALWGLGVTIARSPVTAHRKLAMELYHQALPAVSHFEYPRAWAYSLLGIHEHLRRFSGDRTSKRTRDELATRLFETWQKSASQEWPWIGEELTYANGRLVQALLLSGRWTFENAMIEMGLRALRWLLEVQTSPGEYFEPVGCKGWYLKWGEKAVFDQQPIEAAAMIDACLEAFNITADRWWLGRAKWCFEWYLGNNDLRLTLYDQRTGGCCDALAAHGLNDNQGAESTLCWLMSLLSMYDFFLDGAPQKTSAKAKQSSASPESAAISG